MQIRGKGERWREVSKYESKWFLKTDEGTFEHAHSVHTSAWPAELSPWSGCPGLCFVIGEGSVPICCSWPLWTGVTVRQLWTSTLCLRSTLEPRTLYFASDHPSLSWSRVNGIGKSPIFIPVRRAGEDSEYGRPDGIVLMLHWSFLSGW